MAQSCRISRSSYIRREEERFRRRRPGVLRGRCESAVVGRQDVNGGFEDSALQQKL